MSVLGLAFATLIIVSGVWLAFEVTQTRPKQEVVQREAARADQERRNRETEAPSPAVVVMALTVGPGVRTADTAPPTSLLIPADTAEVRMQFTMQEHKYVAYRVILRAVGGGDVARRGPLTVTPAGSGATITLNVPTGQFQSGDYLLTLQGQTRAGDIEDVSQSILRVDKR